MKRMKHAFKFILHSVICGVVLIICIFIASNGIPREGTIKAVKDLTSVIGHLPSVTGQTGVIPTVYIITPTYRRLHQKAALTRLSNTLRLVPKLHWILVEDSPTKTSTVQELLQSSGLSYSHLNKEKLPEPGTHRPKRRGWMQRNAGLQWLRANGHGPGVVYFGDDDNTYSLELFEEMRYTRTISIWPVGFAASQRYEGPIIKHGKVDDWLTAFGRNRKFPTDMAGFAVNFKFLTDHPEAKFRHVQPGYMESDFLSQFKLAPKDLEVKANNCTKVLVWHTRDESNQLHGEKKLIKIFGHGTDLKIEV